MRYLALFALIVPACGGQLPLPASPPLAGTWAVTNITDIGEVLVLTGSNESISGSYSDTDFGGNRQPSYALTGDSKHLEFHRTDGSVDVYGVVELTSDTLELSNDFRYARAK